MNDVFQSLGASDATTASSVLVRLASALVLGLLVAAIHRRLRPSLTASFSGTLVMLSVLIAMVTQVIGDNVARAFSLVGALSIVRFRTVVRDTQDTAYVIFAVAVGMASGAANLLLAILGVCATVCAAVLARSSFRDEGVYALEVRLNLGTNPQTLGSVLAGECSSVEQLGAQTARQGAAVEVHYRIALRPGHAPHDLVTALNRQEGVQGVAVTPDLPQG